MPGGQCSGYSVARSCFLLLGAIGWRANRAVFLLQRAIFRANGQVFGGKWSGASTNLTIGPKCPKLLDYLLHLSELGDLLDGRKTRRIIEMVSLVRLWSPITLPPIQGEYV